MTPMHSNTLRLLSVPNSRNLGVPHLSLQLEDTVHQGLARRGASRDVNIDRHNPVAATDHAVAVVIVTSSVGAAAHADDPSGFRHLIVDLTQGRGHLVGEGAGNNHDVRLTWRGTENDSQSILVVSWCRQVHHLDGAARETEGHGP
jgi:hypothetical protein